MHMNGMLGVRLEPLDVGDDFYGFAGLFERDDAACTIFLCRMHDGDRLFNPAPETRVAMMH